MGEPSLIYHRRLRTDQVRLFVTKPGFVKSSLGCATLILVPSFLTDKVVLHYTVDRR